MKVYLAGPYAARTYMAGVSAHLTERGFEIVSAWTSQTHPIGPGTVDTAPSMSDDYTREQVADDLACVAAADVLVVFSGKFLVEHHILRSIAMTTSGGRHIETGYALALGKPVLLVGEPENIFHRGACIQVGKSELIKSLRQLEATLATH